MGRSRWGQLARKARTPELTDLLANIGQKVVRAHADTLFADARRRSESGAGYALDGAV